MRLTQRPLAIIIFMLILLITQVIASATETGDDIIIYSLGFVRLNSQATNAVKALISVTHPGETDDAWGIYGSPELAKIVIENQPELGAQLDVDRSNREDYALYRSWLASAGKEPVSVRLAETILTGTEYVDKVLANFELAMSALAMDQDSSQVLTKVDLKYQSPTGEFSEANVVVWLGELAESPIMVVSKEIIQSGQTETEYFALCAGVSVVAATEMPATAQVLSYGDIEGIRKFISSQYEPSVHYTLDVGLLYSESQTTIELRGDRFYGDQQIYLALDNAEAQLHGTLGIDVPIQSSVKFSSQLLAEYADSTKVTVRAGVLDETVLANLLHLKAACYLARFDFENQQFSHAPQLEISVVLSQPRWSVWYEGSYAWRAQSHQSGFSAMLTPQLGIQARYCFGGTEADRYGVGLLYRYH